MAYTLYKNITTVNREIGKNSKKYIVIHYTGNKTDTAKANSNYFKSVNRCASAHYFVDEKTVYQVVEDNDAAWSVGRNFGNNNLYGKITNYNSINIEMCSTNGKIADATFDNTVALTKSLMSKYNIPASNVYRHWDVCSKNCPGWDGWGAVGKDASIWNNFKKQIGGTASSSSSSTSSSSNTTSTSTASKAGDAVYQAYANGKWWGYITNYNNANSNGYAGVIGQPLRALRAYVKGDAKEVGYLEYRLHKVNGGWYNWQRDRNADKNGENYAGDCKNKFDGLQMRIVGVSGRHVKYRVHVIGKGWLSWVTDYGSGSSGYAGWYGYAIDAVQIDIV